MRKKFSFSLILILCVSIFCSCKFVGCKKTTLYQESSSKTASSLSFEDHLAGVKLGMKVEDLLKTYPNIYKHSLVMGEVLYEACNQSSLEGFTFVEEPWSKGYITSSEIKSAPEVFCRDAKGSLPDFAIAAVSPKGLKLGETEERIIQLYGKPSISRTVKNGNKLLIYKNNGSAPDLKVENLTLYFTIENGVLAGMHLLGDMPGVRKP